MAKSTLEQLLSFYGNARPKPVKEGLEIDVPYSGTRKPISEEGRILIGQMIEDRPKGLPAEYAIPDASELTPASNQRFEKRMETERLLRLLEALDAGQVKEIGL